MSVSVRSIVLALFAVCLLLLLVDRYVDRTRQTFCSYSSRQHYNNVPVSNNGSINYRRTTTSSLWNYDWDMRQQSSRQGESAATVVWRHLVLVRHGQYDLGTGLLTDLGKYQANLTSIRLKEMNFSYSSIIHSNLPRAKQTAEIIQGHLPNIPLTEDSIIAEGGPIQPQPTVSYWSLPDRIAATPSRIVDEIFHCSWLYFIVTHRLKWNCFIIKDRRGRTLSTQCCHLLMSHHRYWNKM